MERVRVVALLDESARLLGERARHERLLDGARIARVSCETLGFARGRLGHADDFLDALPAVLTVFERGRALRAERELTRPVAGVGRASSMGAQQRPTGSSTCVWRP